MHILMRSVNTNPLTIQQYCKILHKRIALENMSNILRSRFSDEI